ncbi:MAG: Rne/Rng family ribonuclease [Deltaproteobacteria bacterium]|nr:Rne/Rng family ribonuclease [Deltaproteobacteria bacterium]
MTDPKKEILIDSNPFETRLAITEDDRLAEFYVERKRDRGITGNIYKGKVVRVLPGMQAAFVEIGLERTAFLHAADVMENVEFEDESGQREEAKGGGRIQDLLTEGQEILVQAEKEPMGTKGARLTSYIALPGRYLVLMPTYGRVGVSRRISNEGERRRLRDIVSKLKPQGVGFIIRTVCEGRRAQEIKADMEFLLKLWQTVSKKSGESRAPALIYGELDLTLRAIRDIFGDEVRRFVIDSKDEHERTVRFVDEFMPELSGRIDLHTGPEAMFDARGIEIELEKALEKKVWLPSGGHIVIDQMEALTAIDVNTGKYVGKKSSEDTILKTNLEALGEIVNQLRLRNIGGIIVIDFIDMTKYSNRDKVYKALKEALKEDKARTNILKVSELGIVEMTRKRTRESITQSLLEPCPYCDGNGLVKGRDTIIMEIYKDLIKELPRRRKKAVVYVNPKVAERLKQGEDIIGELERRFNKRVVTKQVDTFHQEEYEIF